MTVRRKLLSIALLIVSIGLLYPGVTQPVMTLTGTVEKAKVAELGIEMIAGEGADSETRQMLSAISSFLGFDRIDGELVAYHNTRSIWGTVEDLARTGNLPVALLIVFFSLVIPLFKFALQLASLLIASAELRGPVLWLNGALSKWSMSDVFVMGILVAYMAGSASGQMGDLLTMHAALQPGFWYFLAYCLFAIGAGILIQEPRSH
jgi:hypothetical protein